MAFELRDRCTRLFKQYQGDIRACLRRLYDETAETTSLHVTQ
jgi:hypothetical protein